MNINFIDVKTSPSVFTVYAKFPLETFKETKEIYVVTSLETKKRLNTSICVDKYRGGMNETSEKFETFTKREFSYLSGEYSLKHYFIKSKKQGLNEYKEYVAELLQRNFGNFGIESLTVFLRVGNSFE
jgi:hypothetical protein